MPESIRSIAALRRGLDVLSVIGQGAAVSLHDLHERTGIPKATLLRILKTLREGGYVWRDADSGHYLGQPLLPHESEPDEAHEQLARLAAPYRAALQKKMVWPSTLAVLQGHRMLVLEAHQPLTGLSINYRAMGLRPHLIASALGRCYLAFCPDDERERLLVLLRRSPHEMDQLSRQHDRIRRMVREVRAAGYASRPREYIGVDARLAQRFGALVVPIHAGTQRLACLGIAWPAEMAAEAEMATRYVPLLQEAARAIGAAAKG